MKKILALIVCGLLLAGCATKTPEPEIRQVPFQFDLPDLNIPSPNRLNLPDRFEVRYLHDESTEKWIAENPHLAFIVITQMDYDILLKRDAEFAGAIRERDAILDSVRKWQGNYVDKLLQINNAEIYMKCGFDYGPDFEHLNDCADQ